MKSRKILSMVMVGITSASLLVGCNSSDLSSTQDEPTKQEQSEKQEMNLVLMDNEYVTVTILDSFTETFFDGTHAFGFNVKAVNKSDKAVVVMSDMNQSVNGVMDDTALVIDLEPNMEGYNQWVWSDDPNVNTNPKVKSLADLVDIKTVIRVLDAETMDEIVIEAMTINATKLESTDKQGEAVEEPKSESKDNKEQTNTNGSKNPNKGDSSTRKPRYDGMGNYVGDFTDEEVIQYNDRINNAIDKAWQDAIDKEFNNKEDDYYHTDGDNPNDGELQPNESNEPSVGTDVFEEENEGNTLE